MSDNFDPYYLWLSIPPEQQPANFYQLLGLQNYESNSQVIANAADQRMSHIKSMQTGQYATIAEQVLNQLSQARICLLNDEKRTRYDRQIRQAISVDEHPNQPIAIHPVPIADNHIAINQPIPPTSAPPPVPVNQPQVIIQTESVHSQQRFKSKQESNRSQRKKNLSQLVKFVLGGIAGLAIGYVVVSYLNPNSDLLNLFADKQQQKVTKDQQPKKRNSHSRHSGKKTQPQKTNIKPPKETPVVAPNIETPVIDNEKDDPPVVPTPVFDPLANLPSHFKIPNYPDSKTEFNAMALTKLAGLTSQEHIGHFNLTLNTQAANLNRSEAIQLQLAEDGTEKSQSRKWNVTYINAVDKDNKKVDLDKATPEQIAKKIVAFFELKESQLWFQWIEVEGNTEKFGQLINCLLMLRLDIAEAQKKQHLVTLRPVNHIPVITLNLEKEKTEYLLVEDSIVPYPPSSKNVYLDLANTTFPISATWKVDSRQLTMGKDHQLLFSGIASGVILNFRLIHSKRGYLLRVTSNYKNGINKFPFTTTMVEKSKQRIPAQLIAATKKLASLQNSLRNLQAKYRREKAISPSTKTTIAIRRAIALKNLSQSVRNTNQKIVRTVADIKSFKVAISKLPNLESAVTTLHKKVQLKIQVYVKTDVKEIVLVRTTDPLEKATLE